VMTTYNFNDKHMRKSKTLKTMREYKGSM
jgi:hypothetical protein